VSTESEPAKSRRLPRNVIVLSGVSFFQDAASELLYPVLPLFLTSARRLGGLAAPVAVVGLIEGVAEATASLMRVISGRLADRRQRRPLVAAGYGISSLSKLLIGFATGWPLVLVARFFDRAGKGVRGSPRDALIAAETTPENRGRSFGFHRAADTSGAVVGPLLGLGLYEALHVAHHHNFKPLFFFAFIPAAISVVLIALVREHPNPNAGKAKAKTLKLGGDGLPARYWRVVAVLALFGLVNFSDAFLILRAKALGLSFVAIILVYCLYNVAYAGLSYPAGVVSDRMPRRIVFAVGLVIFAVAYLGLGFATKSAWVWVLLPVYGGYTALTDGVGKAWIADLVPTEKAGSGLGNYLGITGAAALVAGIWAGLTWHGTGRFPLIVAGSVTLVVAVGLLVSGRSLDAEAELAAG
jgi:MFS family permease